LGRSATGSAVRSNPATVSRFSDRVPRIIQRSATTTPPQSSSMATNRLPKRSNPVVKTLPKRSDPVVEPLPKRAVTVVDRVPDNNRQPLSRNDSGTLVERSLGNGTKVIEWKPTLIPLHKRLKAFRDSTLLESHPSKPSNKNDLASEPLPLKQPSRLATETQSVQLPTSFVGTTPVEPSLVPHRSPQVSPAEPMLVGQRTLPKDASSDVASLAEELTIGKTTRLTAMAGATVRHDQNVLFHCQSPILNVETVGPRRITVGKESAFEVTVQNSGEVAADEVVVFVNLPQWTDVLGAEASTGATHAAVSGEPGEPFQWKVGHLAANSSERLVLRVMPRESRPFDLAVRWDYQPIASQTMIEIQEPKLVMNLGGPREILFGEKEIFQLKLSNVGTGDADNVVITLSPNGTGDNQPVSQNLGTIEAGGQKSIEVELTARQVGNLVIKVAVRGDAGVYAELAEKVLVRRAALQVDVQGPKVQYVGAVASYQIRVSNPGTAPAKNIELSVKVPPGAKYLSGIDDSRLEANGTKVAWTLDNLNPSSEQNFVIQCSLGLPGSNRIEVVSTASGDLTASADTATDVEAIADLTLSVKDPSGPIPVGEETSYELMIRNRGTKNAEDVEVVAYFSRGIEPTKAEGNTHQIGSGQVAFSPIPSIAAGGQAVLTIHARAETPGNHVFRAEVSCKATGTRLLSEETTHFYQTERKALQDSGVPAEKATLPPPAAPSRTADQRQATVPAPVAGPQPGPLQVPQRPQQLEPTPAVLR